MRTIHRIVALIGMLSLIFFSCNKHINQEEQEVPQAVKDKIFALGFSVDGVQKIEGGWLVEGDIVISNEELAQITQTQFLRIAENEQYRTSNLVISLPRTITISLATNFPPSYSPSLDEAIRRFNSENLRIKFQRVSSNADISLVKTFANFLASAGFPLSSGAPYHTIKINAAMIGYGNNTKTFINHLATIMAHEIGHCIGFRHTDYMDRSFSCGGRRVNEGSTSSAAILVPGTPSRPDSASWMLVCINPGQNRPFNPNDRIALNYLY